MPYKSSLIRADYNKKYYAMHREKRQKQAKARYIANQKTIIKQKRRSRLEQKMELIKRKGRQCLLCGLKATKENAAGFDFHHREPCKKRIDITRTTNKEKIEKELEKVDLLCAVCHRVIHSTWEI